MTQHYCCMRQTALNLPAELRKRPVVTMEAYTEGIATSQLNFVSAMLDRKGE